MMTMAANLTMLMAVMITMIMKADLLMSVLLEPGRRNR